MTITALFSGLQRQPLKQPATRENTVAVYGGASMKEGSALYEFSKDVGRAMGEAGFHVLTGGGPGSMKAAAEGANEVGAHTIGIAMPFIGEEPFHGNKELHSFDDFSSRIDKGYEVRAGLTAAVPGGIGTLQEITKKLAEVYTEKTLYPSQRQIVLFERNGYWQKFIDYLKDGPIAEGLMNPKCLNFVKIAQTIPEGIQMLKNSVPWTKGVFSKNDLNNAELELEMGVHTPKPQLEVVA